MSCGSTTICFLSLACDSFFVREIKCQNTMSPKIPIPKSSEHTKTCYTKVIAILKGSNVDL